MEGHGVAAEAGELHQPRLGAERILLAAPDGQPAVGELRGDVDRLHRRMVQIGHAVLGLDHASAGAAAMAASASPTETSSEPSAEASTRSCSA